MRDLRRTANLFLPSPHHKSFNKAGIKLKKVCATDAASMVEATKTSMSSEVPKASKKCSSDTIDAINR